MRIEIIFAGKKLNIFFSLKKFYQNRSKFFLGKISSIYFFVLRGWRCKQELDAFELNLHSQLVIGYHWLTFLNQLCRNLIRPNLLRTLSTKFTICQQIQIGTLFFHRFHNNSHLFGPKTRYGHFFFGGGGQKRRLHVVNWDRACIFQMQ